MAVIMPKQATPSAAESNYIKLFLNETGSLASIDEDGKITIYAKGTRVDTVFAEKETFTINNYSIQAKELFLKENPMPNSVRFSVLGCLDQVEGEGFYVEGNSIKWDNFGLDGFLDIGDIVQIHYTYYN